MDTGKIKIFLRSAETESFSKVAEEFNYTPSAISHMCDSIEEELGLKLLTRNFSGVKLNEVGRALYPELKRFVEVENEIMFLAKTLGQKQKQIRIGVYSSLASTILPQILKKFKKDMPEINVSINVLSHEFQQLMKNNTIDLLFSSDIDGFNFEWLPLFEDPYYVALPENEQLKEKTINKEDLYNYPLIMTEKRIIQKNFDISKFKDVLDYKTEDYSLALDMVKEGVGVTLIPNVAKDKRIKGVKYVKLQPEIKRIIGLYYKKPMLRRKEIKTLIEYLKNYK